MQLLFAYHCHHMGVTTHVISKPSSTEDRFASSRREDEHQSTGCFCCFDTSLKHYYRFDLSQSEDFDGSSWHSLQWVDRSATIIKDLFEWNLEDAVQLFLHKK